MSMIKNKAGYVYASLIILVGIVAAVGALIFKSLIAVSHNLFFLGSFSFHYDGFAHTAAGSLGAWIIIMPVIGAILVAYLVSNFAPEAKGHGVPEVMFAIFYQKAIIRPIVAIIKSIASAISIGSGGAGGCEGPIIQIGSTFGSFAGQYVKTITPLQRAILIACGASSGLAATFNAPISGVLFAIELLLPIISISSVLPVMVSTIIATFVGRYFFGHQPIFELNLIHSPASSAVSEIMIYVIFGIITGFASFLFIYLLYWFEDFFEEMPGNYYTRHMSGMLIVGIIIYIMMKYTGHYYIAGFSYSTIYDILHNLISDPYFLLLLCVLKLVVTCLTIGSGASGGIFSPSLVIGATIGSFCAMFLNKFVPGIHINPALMAVIGMAGVVSGTTGAIMASIAIVFEMTDNYSIILPLMITSVVASISRQYFISETIYTRKLNRRGQVIPEAAIRCKDYTDQRL